MANRKDSVTELEEVERAVDFKKENGELKAAVAGKIHQDQAQFFLEAIQTYTDDDAIDRDAEKRLKRKLDWHILPFLGICYFFYVSDPLW